MLGKPVKFLNPIASYQKRVQEEGTPPYEELLSVDKLVKLDRQYIAKEYHCIERLTSSADHEDRCFKTREARQYNRYTDILAYTDTRVKLEDGAKPDYINACYVDVSHLMSM